MRIFTRTLNTDFRGSLFFTVSCAACLLLLISLGGCASSGEADNPPPEKTADEIYQDAEAAMEGKNYAEATRLFEDVERQYPYSTLATDAQIQAALSSYKDQRYLEAILALERFIELHPGHDHVDYAYYLIALSYYDQISDVRRDQEITRQALDSLNNLLRRFPDSPYARDAAYKRDLTLDHLAGKEMEIGRYYLKRGQINAAINRFREVISSYQTTTHTPEALHRLVECYLILGLKDEALHVAAVLGYNYPGSEWYQKSYNLLDPDAQATLKQDTSWFGRTVEGLLNRQAD